MQAASYRWREALERALEANRQAAHSRYLQLATVGLDGHPRNRTVVFRGFSQDARDLVVITDSRSQKIEEIAALPQAELCWYFTETREQYRISGAIHCIAAGDASGEREALWATLSPATQAQFFGPAPLGPLDAPPLQPQGSEQPVDHFCLLRITPQRVDHLLLTTPQQRFVSRSVEREWDWEAVNP